MRSYFWSLCYKTRNMVWFSNDHIIRESNATPSDLQQTSYILAHKAQTLSLCSLSPPYLSHPLTALPCTSSSYRHTHTHTPCVLPNIFFLPWMLRSDCHCCRTASPLPDWPVIALWIFVDVCVRMHVYVSLNSRTCPVPSPWAVMQCWRWGGIRQLYTGR